MPLVLGTVLWVVVVTAVVAIAAYMVDRSTARLERKE
jgi:preprotein translocase subunit SecE